MSKLRKTFVGIALEIQERRRLVQTLDHKRERRSRHTKLILTILAVLAAGGGVCYAGKGLVFDESPPVHRTAPAWKELAADADAHFQALAFTRELMAAKSHDQLKALWSPNVPPESFLYVEKTLELFKGGALDVQSVRQKADGAPRFEVLCKAPGHGHRLKLSLQGGNGGLKLTNAEMAP